MTPPREPLSKIQQDAVQASIDQRAKELEAALLDVIIQSAPVFQSADALKKSIDEILGAIDSDQFEHAAAMKKKCRCRNVAPNHVLFSEKTSDISKPLTVTLYRRGATEAGERLQIVKLGSSRPVARKISSVAWCW